MKNETINIRKVAERAGVSPATVSRVLNGKSKVDPALADAVNNTVAELGYKKRIYNHVRSNSSVITAIFPLLTDTYFIPALDGIIDEASEHGFSVAVMKSANGQDLACLERAVALKSAGIIYAPSADENPLGFVPGLSDIPLVILGRKQIDPHFCHASLDSRKAAYLSTRYLLRLGRRRIVFFSHFWTPRVSDYATFMKEFEQPGMCGKFSTYDRFAGYCQAFREFGLEPAPELIRFSGFGYEDGTVAVKELLASGIPFDSVLTPNDRFGAGALKVLQRQGLRVPEDVSIVCLIGDLTANLVSPSLTTITADSVMMGRRSMQAIMKLLRGERAENITVDVNLLIRGSTFAVTGTAEE